LHFVVDSEVDLSPAFNSIFLKHLAVTSASLSAGALSIFEVAISAAPNARQRMCCAILIVLSLVRHGSGSQVEVLRELEERKSFASAVSVSAQKIL
jgi:hypothetical protein